METWILIFILIGISFGLYYTSKQLASIDFNVGLQTEYSRKQLHEVPPISVPSADEIAAAIFPAIRAEIGQLKRAIEWQIGFPEQDPNWYNEPDLSEPVNLKHQLYDVKDIKDQLVFIGIDLKDIRDQLEVIGIDLKDIKDQLEVIGILLTQNKNSELTFSDATEEHYRYLREIEQGRP